MHNNKVYNTNQHTLHTGIHSELAVQKVPQMYLEPTRVMEYITLLCVLLEYYNKHKHLSTTTPHTIA